MPAISWRYLVIVTTFLSNKPIQKYITICRCDVWRTHKNLVLDWTQPKRDRQCKTRRMKRYSTTQPIGKKGLHVSEDISQWATDPWKKRDSSLLVAYRPVVQLPVSVIIDQMLPFSDWATWNNVILTSREIYQGSLKFQSPWPSLRIRSYGLLSYLVK